MEQEILVTSSSKKELALTAESTISKKEIALTASGATREVAYNAIVEALGAESMTVDKFGDEHVTPDHQARLKAAEMISRLHGDLKEAGSVSLVTNNISLSVEDIKPLVDMVKDMDIQLASLRISGKQTGEIIDVSVA